MSLDPPVGYEQLFQIYKKYQAIFTKESSHCGSFSVMMFAMLEAHFRDREFQIIVVLAMQSMYLKDFWLFQIALSYPKMNLQNFLTILSFWYFFALSNNLWNCKH